MLSVDLSGSPWQPRDEEPKKAPTYASDRLVPKKRIKPLDAAAPVSPILNPKRWDKTLIDNQDALFELDGGEVL